jgi:two-component system, NtrC family, nitrogen regulation sensor histidine kinase NtrY
VSKDTSPLPRAERRRRRIEYVIIVAAALALLGLGYLEANLYRFSIDVQLPNSILVFTMINVNLLLLLLLLFFLIRNIIKLVIERRNKVVWSKLRTRLVVVFTLFSLLPTALLFFLTTGMIKRSIEGWFHGQVNRALQNSVRVGEFYTTDNEERALYYAMQAAALLESELMPMAAARQQEAQDKGDGLESVPAADDAFRIDMLDDSSLALRLERLRRVFGLWGLELYDPEHRLVAIALEEGVEVSSDRFSFRFPAPEDGLDGVKGSSRLDIFAGQDMARAYSPLVSPLDGETILAYVVADVSIPQNLLRSIVHVNQSYDEYSRIRSLASPLKTSYIFTLIMVFAMVILLSTWVGLYLSRSISEPIQELAEATKEISRGNLDVRVPPSGDDEIGSVIDSFNAMTAELSTNKESLQQANWALQERNQQVEASKHYIETVLASVAAGVVSLDRNGRITTVNVHAAGLLNILPEKGVGADYRGVLEGEALRLVAEVMETLQSGTHNLQRQWVLTTGEDVKTLLVNATAMHADDGRLSGAVLVFDDLTELIKAQRAAAWREVARRIAHEVKNPLTPIQLSAQRLRKRYLQRFDNEHDRIFDQATKVIIEQVEAMKGLVNEFSQFARMPHANLSPNDLNAVVSEVETLYRQAHRNIRIVFEPDDSVPLVDLDKDQVKRVVMNLLDNAVAALNGGGTITIRTRYEADLRVAVLEISDSGPGISAEDRQRIFEPYYTTKHGGTGLGLSIVKKIIEEHRGYVRVHANNPTGALFVIELPVAEENLRIA